MNVAEWKEDEINDADLEKLLKKGHDNDVPSAMSVDFFDTTSSQNDIKSNADEKVRRQTNHHLCIEIA